MGSLQSLSKGKGRRKKPQVITGTVGQTITLSMYTRDRFAGIFYHVDVTPDEYVLKFVRDFEEKKDESTTAKREYVALKKGITSLQYGLYSHHLGKFLGNTSYEIVVE